MAILAVIVMTAFLGIFAILQLSSVNDVTTEVTNTWLPSVAALGKMNADVNAVQRAALGHTLSSNKDLQAAMNTQYANAATDMQQLLAGCEKTVTSDEDRKRFEAFKGTWTTYLESAGRAMALGREMKMAEATAMLAGEAKKHLLEVENLVKLGTEKPARPLRSLRRIA